MKRNRNHPLKGSKITVDPIRDTEKINEIKGLLKDQPRNLLLFTLGINNGIRTGDLLRLKVKQLRSLKPGESIVIRESKTGKTNILMLNQSGYAAFCHFVEKLSPSDEDYVFQSRKQGQPLTIQTVNALIKLWTHSTGLQGNFGAHSLRKTFGYIQRTEYKVGFDVLAKRFNHSSPAVTMRYLGITDTEVNNILQNEI